MGNDPASQDIRHVVVLMLENRSFDCMLGLLYPGRPDFDGLTGTEGNIWHKPDGSHQAVGVWQDPLLSAVSACIPDPDPGELFTDIRMQIQGLTESGAANPGGPTMGGFVDNYMRQKATTPAADPRAVMHSFTPDQVPVLSGLAKAFAVSDRWHASAPCQTWPNRFFAHTGTAEGHVNNSPTHFPYLMKTVYDRLDSVGKTSRIYFHDFPQTATLARLWYPPVRFSRFAANFAADAAAGTLPHYSFIEPRYFTDVVANHSPNDQHPPHNVAYGEGLIAEVYNAVRAGPGWLNTLLVITYDEHGGCYDHVVPPPATPPDGLAPDGFAFDRFGVRVPAVIVSPYIRAGSVIRPPGATPFDHSSILATLGKLHGFAPLTQRDAAAPDLLGCLASEPDMNCLASITAPAIPPTVAQVADLAVQPPNNLQQSLGTAAAQLPTAGADIDTHIARLAAVLDVVPDHATVGAAAGAVAAHMAAFMG